MRQVKVKKLRQTVPPMANPPEQKEMPLFLGWVPESHIGQEMANLVEEEVTGFVPGKENADVLDTRTKLTHSEIGADSDCPSRQNIRVGDLVKIPFKIIGDVPPGLSPAMVPHRAKCESENMWVRVQSIDRVEGCTRYQGKLESRPVMIGTDLLRSGSKVTFGARHVCDHISKDQE